MITDVAVIVPAADEQQRIDRCLTAIARARDRATVDARVIVVLDHCTDRTADVVARHEGVLTVESSARNVGVARELGSRYALDTARNPDDLWLANTDADSLVPSDWLTHMVEQADHGADLVLGTVTPGPGLAPRRRAAWSSHYRSHAGHPHIHGANLGVRASALTALGGWRPLITGEDVDLVARAVRAGYTVHRTDRIPVTTSARTVGRAPRGFSSYLRALR